MSLARGRRRHHQRHRPLRQPRRLWCGYQHSAGLGIGLERDAQDRLPRASLGHQRLNPTSHTDARGNVTSYDYGGQEQQPGAIPTRIAEPLARTSAIAVDARGNLSRLDVAGQATSYEYDGQGRRTRETDGLGNVSTYGYDANGNETTRTVTRTINGTTRTETTWRKISSTDLPVRSFLLRFSESPS